ncbi:ATP-binding protein [Nocardioides sp. YIM 152315]|uniref:sensor histidine kinase n=1 Tax=Nocardioides sp. YIM 152315 TaxID=3031760 RepID=UPI0023DAB36B|nr:ATP-binding protein [Nocardioides sp. YIM 152315]MDF1605167.1 ATP-binding protein [Nocardioides sp. YIM 152315]
MATDAPESKPDDHATWSDSSARAVLQLMVESVAEMVGFEVAALSVVLGDELVTLAYTGPEEHREFLEESDPVSVIEPVLARAQTWGPRLRFIEATALEELEGHWVEIEQVPTDAADSSDAWRPDDGLLAVLSGDDGGVVGILSVDRPSSGRRPDDRQRSLLERYAAQAERAVLTLFERQALLQQVAHAESARRLIRSASRPTHGSVEDVLRHTHGPLVTGFDARGSWLQVFQPDGPSVGVLRADTGELLPLAPDLVEVVEKVAPTLWAEQRPAVLTADTIPAGLPAEIREHLVQRDVASVLGIALGVGDECVGFLALSRHADQSSWSQAEIDSALQIGHDLGAALMTARALERERNLVHELQQIDDYRSQLVATLSHELRTPLTVISGNLELLGTMELDPGAERCHRAMSRGAQRMGKVVDDLLLLARVSNPHHPLERVPVDLRSVTRDVVSLVEFTAASKGVTLTVDLEPDELVVPGDPVELDRLVGNLVSNAVKYTPAGGTITVSAARRADEVVLGVADTGLGISEDDRQGLFRAFFRTTNPDALREPGTGLGLAIVATILERHGGRVDVGSRLGEGTTFTVTLPAA